MCHFMWMKSTLWLNSEFRRQTINSNIQMYHSQVQHRSQLSVTLLKKVSFAGTISNCFLLSFRSSQELAFNYRSIENLITQDLAFFIFSFTIKRKIKEPIIECNQHSSIIFKRPSLKTTAILNRGGLHSSKSLTKL